MTVGGTVGTGMFRFQVIDFDIALFAVPLIFYLGHQRCLRQRGWCCYDHRYTESGVVSVTAGDISQGGG